MEEFGQTIESPAASETKAPQEPQDTLAPQVPQKPQDSDVEVNDENYTLSSYPKAAEGYVIDEAITSGAAYDENFHKEFNTFAFDEHLNQGQHGEVIKFWEKNAKNFDGDVDALALKFAKTAKRINLSVETVQNLKNLLTGSIEKNKKTIARIRETSLRARGMPGSETRAALMDNIMKSTAYVNKGNTSAERAAHKEAVRIMNELTQGRNPFQNKR
ncbi:MAG: hypothetical protein FVQ84_09210 [Planctomycetes bacterium]|nr:hypothetical protein [Planctomycetota bacterium]